MNSTMCTALLTLLSMTLFAGNSVLCRLALLEYKMEPVTYTAVRLISGALMLWLIMAVRHKNVFKSGTWPGALSLFTYMACFSWAYVELPTAVGTLIIAVAVQTTMIGFGFFSGERPSRQQGIGIGIAASKVKGIRVCTCSDVYSAELSKRHNNSNILTMGARVVGVDLAKMIATHWLTAEFEGGRHQRRVDEITAIENGEEL